MEMNFSKSRSFFMKRMLIAALALVALVAGCTLESVVPELEIETGVQSHNSEESGKAVLFGAPISMSHDVNKEVWTGYRVKNTPNSDYDVYGPFSAIKGVWLKMALMYKFGQNADLYLKWTKPGEAFDPKSGVPWDLSSTNGIWMRDELMISKAQEECFYVGVRGVSSITEYSLVIVFPLDGFWGERYNTKSPVWRSPTGRLEVRGKDLEKEAIHTAPEVYSISPFCSISVGPAERGKVLVYVKEGSKPTYDDYDAILTNGERWTYYYNEAINKTPTKYYYFIKSTETTTDYGVTVSYHSNIYFTGNVSLPGGTATPGPVLPPIIHF
jgi:hypothetical protein